MPVIVRIKREHLDVLQHIYMRAYAGMERYAYTERRRVRSYLRWLMKRDPEGGFLAHRCGIPAGFVFCDAKRYPAAVHELAVLPEHRRRGIGSSLLSRALEHLKSSGHSLVELWVGASNLPAQRLYRSFGFREVARLCDWVVMHLRI